MNKVYLALLFIVVLSSCKKSLPDVGGTAAQKMANEWWVTAFVSGTDVIGTHVKIKTYNTSDNGNQLWVDDYPDSVSQSGNVYGFQVKAQADFSAMSFSANQVVSSLPGYGIKVNITDGKVITNGGHSKSGVVTDSIYMKMEFEDDPGTIYEVSGHGRTRFIEDDY